MSDVEKTTEKAAANGELNDTDFEEFIDFLSPLDEDDHPISSHRLQRRTNTPILAGAGILFLVILFAFLYKAEKNTFQEELASIKARLDQFEKRSMPYQNIEDRIFCLEKQGGNLQKSILQTNKSLETKLDGLATEFHQLKRDILSVAQNDTPSTVQQTPQNANKRYHEVRPGETLYQIGEHYGISMEALCRLNSLNSGHIIQPGQKLLVSLDS